MYCFAKFCHVCLNNKCALQTIQKSDEIFKQLQHKFESCLLKMDLNKINENVILICENCCNNLQISYEFINMLRETNAQKDDYINRLKNDTHPNQNKLSQLNIDLIALAKDSIVNDKYSDDFTTIEEESITSTGSNVSGIFECHICFKLYNRYISFIKHINNHTNAKFVCNVCNKEFSSKMFLDRHNQAVHSSASEFVPPNYECSTCGKLFRTNISLHSHKLKPIYNGSNQCYYFKDKNISHTIFIDDTYNI